MVGPAVRRGDVFLVGLDPTLGKELRKSRPCVVVSPDELNRHLRTVIVAPMTTGGRAYPFRVGCRFKKKDGYVVLDQIRTVGVNRLVRKMGRLSPKALAASLEILQEMFAD
ncbi:MAG: type II toxin-antitoxin system PemK/MazF family toxin [Gemmatimonadetes bacterium]|nr:type II toxin-antitoxin system PemK/MazF family toxin [Gemmatimonadota bacterium]